MVKELRCAEITDNSTLDEIATQVLKWLNVQEGWLLVLDNVDDVTVVRDLLPATQAGGHTLITTRVKDVKQIPAEGLEVNLMEEREAIELLIQASDNDLGDRTIQEAKNIVRELERLPLAIDQAAAFIRNSDLYSFLQIFRSNTMEFLSERPEGNHPYPTSISTIWSVSFNRLSPLANEFAEVLAFLNPDEILVEFLEAGCCGLSENLCNVIKNKFVLIKTLRELQSLSLIKVWERGTKLSIHRLVQSVIRENLSSDSRIIRQKEVLGMNSSAFKYSLFGQSSSRERCRKFLSQVMASLTRYDEEAYNLFAISDLSTTLAAFLFDEGHGFESQSLNERVLDIRMRILGPDDPRTLSVMRGLAAVYTGFGGWDRVVGGIRLFQEALEGQTRVLGPMHPDTLWTKHGLAVTYDKVGRVSEGSLMLEETYNARCQILGPEDVHTLRSKYFLGRSCYSRGLSLEALNLLEETLVAQCRTLGRTHFDSIRTMHFLAIANAELGLNENALLLFREASLLKNRALGSGHPLARQYRHDLENFERHLGEGRLVRKVGDSEQGSYV
jgi:NB-ARC domain